MSVLRLRGYGKQFDPSQIDDAVFWGMTRETTDFEGYNAGAFTEWKNKINGYPNLINGGDSPFAFNATKLQVEASQGSLYNNYDSFFTGLAFTIVVVNETLDVSLNDKNRIGLSNSIDDNPLITSFDRYVSSTSKQFQLYYRYDNTLTANALQDYTENLGEKKVQSMMVAGHGYGDDVEIRTNLGKRYESFHPDVNNPVLDRFSIGSLIRPSTAYSQTHCAGLFLANRYLTDEELQKVIEYFQNNAI